MATEPSAVGPTTIEEARTFLQLVPDTYLLAKARYPFLPARSVSLDVYWADLSPMARAVFLLDYVARLYTRVPLDSVLESPRPLVIFRTTDHPAAAQRDPRVTDPRAYAVFFDTDAGVRVEMHMGHLTRFALGEVLRTHGAARGRGGRA